ncbi:hypothetical protein [Nocardioides sp.]|uniref:hypothetical protein n=1 Tax=Nocardioides sp. TaxID=35761 RepID=UPI002B54115C|nr:hypothetical protein [Nocardioides sp.]HXH76976.1 hypothetical protein [Nocardioides sp.]
MVNDLRSLLHETSDNAPHDHYDVASTIRLGNSRLRRRRATVTGACALAASAVIGSALVLGGSTDRTPPDGPTTEPVGEVLDLQDATASDLEPILRYEIELAFATTRFVDGVTEAGQALVRDATNNPNRWRSMLVDLATGAETSLPALPGPSAWLLEATDERIVYNYDNSTLQSGPTTREVGALVLDVASDTWREMRWPDLPEGTVLDRDVGPDGRMYVSINPDAEDLDTMTAEGLTGDLWSVSLTDPADVRDEGLVVGGFAIDGDHLVWSERAGGVSNQLTVRDMQTGEETSFDPQSGRHCTQTYLGLDSDRIVMSQSCGTEGGVTDDRVQVVTMTGEPVVTFRDDNIWGHVDGGGHVLIEATERGDEGEGVYFYDLATGDFVRLSTSIVRYVPPAQVAAGYLLWAEGLGTDGMFAQTIARVP